MTEVNFNNLLSKKVDETERPKPLPAGTYLCTVKGHEFDKSAKKGTPFVRFNMTPIAPQDDVDTEAFAEFGGNEKAASKTLNHDCYLTDDSLFRLKEFLEDVLGLSCSGRTYAEVIPETTNLQLLVSVSHQVSSKDNTTIYAVVDGVAKAE